MVRRSLKRTRSWMPINRRHRPQGGLAPTSTAISAAVARTGRSARQPKPASESIRIAMVRPQHRSGPFPARATRALPSRARRIEPMLGRPSSLRLSRNNDRTTPTTTTRQGTTRTTTTMHTRISTSTTTRTCRASPASSPDPLPGHPRTRTQNLGAALPSHTSPSSNGSVVSPGGLTPRLQTGLTPTTASVAHVADRWRHDPKAMDRPDLGSRGYLRTRQMRSCARRRNRASGQRAVSTDPGQPCPLEPFLLDFQP